MQVKLSEFKIEPASIQAEPQQPLILQFTNHGTAPHQIALDAGGKTLRSAMLDPGASGSLDVPGLKAGSYDVWCTVPGHREAGMQAQLVVGSSPGATAQTSGDMSSMTAEQIADAEAAPIKAFPAETAGTGSQPLKVTTDGGVKVFKLTADEVHWETAPGQFVDGFAYNGQIPGPEIHVQPGDHFRVELTNAMDDQPTTIHFHGMTTPNAMDGVPFISQDPVMPGETFTYEFTVKDGPGTYMYHSHMNALEQVGDGLFGAVIVDPPRPAADVEQTIVLGDGPLGYTLNAKSFPATAPIVAKPGQTVLLHLLNAGQQLHPMHLHGYHFQVLRQDGQPVAKPDVVDTLVVAPGQTFDVLIDAVHPGIWPFHCHILSHVDSSHGMFGMVTALVVK